MFATRYYAARAFAPRYFPKVGADPIAGAFLPRLTLVGAGCWLLWSLITW